MTTIAIVAGEVSGDYLAAGLILALRQRLPDVNFIGIAGPKMIEAGCDAHFAQEKLAVMGFTEALGRLPEIYGIRRKFRKFLINHPPDLMIGVDAPDFNLELELKLREQGIKTIHYVSPSVWAWRAERIHKIKKAVDRVLTLFPFEADFYRRHHVPVSYVGHPLADAIDIQVDQAASRDTLGIKHDATVIGVLPGSRRKEVEKIGPVFCKAMARLHQVHPDWVFTAPLATEKTRLMFEQQTRQLIPDIPVQIVDKQAREVMIASDLLMVASGTATLEALLCKRPMVVAYKMAASTWWYMQRKFIVDRYALPNHLSDHDVALELYQEKATPQAIADEILRLYDSPDEVSTLKQEFTGIHQQLRCDASEKAADAVMEVLNGST